MTDLKIVDVIIKDIRFPTSLLADGSDAMHKDPDYSCAYVTLKTQKGLEGYGLTFTCGRGTEVVVQACKSLTRFVKGQNAEEIFANFSAFWRTLTSDTQLRWIGPEKGAMHLATAAIVNALWDLWGRLEGKPVWKLLSDMSPEQLVSTIDFRYITDVITKEEAIRILKEKQAGRTKQENILREKGFPAYTTQVGWLGYSDEKVRELCKKFLSLGFTSFKAKVGQNIEDDIRRCGLIREMIGYKNNLMIDANQIWEVDEAVEWVKKLAQFKPVWIEEPTSPDDILGHAKIARELKPYGVGVATGEVCANRIIFKQLLQAKAIDYCQIDSARIGGINEIISVYLMSHKFGVPVCPHAGGVGLCEMVQHLQMWDFVCLSQTSENRVIEYVDQQHEHFEHPTDVQNAVYMPPNAAGYSTKIFEKSLLDYEYPGGREWTRMYKEGLFTKPAD